MSHKFCPPCLSFTVCHCVFARVAVLLSKVAGRVARFQGTILRIETLVLLVWTRDLLFLFPGGRERPASFDQIRLSLKGCPRICRLGFFISTSFCFLQMFCNGCVVQTNWSCCLFLLFRAAPFGFSLFANRDGYKDPNLDQFGRSSWQS